MGFNAIALMGEAYRASGKLVILHDEKIQELERRRWDVKPDYDVLQRAQPRVPDTIDGKGVEI